MPVPLWRQCIDWLKRIGLLPSGHRLLEPDVTPEKLCACLRDGVLLCLALNRLKPNTIDVPREVSLLPHDSEFLCVANIMVFRNRCQAVFRLRNADILDSQNLYNMEKFEKTLNTLSVLSKSTVAQEFGGYRGFPDVSDPSVWRSEQPIYDNLPPVESSYLPTEKYYNTYDYLLIDEEKDRNSSDFGSPKEPDLNSDRYEVDFVISELIQREEAYTETLMNIQKYFMIPLKRLLPPQTNENLFIVYESQLQGEKHSVFTILYDLHHGFLQQLKSVSNTSRAKMVDGISSCFQCYDEFYFPYSYYFSHYHEATDTLEISLGVSEHFRNEVEAAEREFAQNSKVMLTSAKLREALRKPFDHVTRYTELLKRLKKLTEQIYDDENTSKVVGIACDGVAKFLHFANEYQGEMCAIKNLRQIQKGIITAQPLNLFDMGQKMLDGKLKVSESDLQRCGLVEPKKGGISVGFRDYQLIQAFLFEKNLILCEPTQDPSKFVFVLRLYLADWRCDSIDITAGITAWGGGYSHLFYLENQQGQQIRFLLKKLDDKENWLREIRLAQNIAELKVRHHHQFVSISYLITKPTILSKCEYCKEYITNFGYICRYCDYQLHYGCITQWQNFPICNIGDDINSCRPALDVPLDRKIFWWGGVLTGPEASMQLRNRPMGTFMVRFHSSRGFRVTSISNNWGEVLHLVILEERNNFCFGVDGLTLKFSSLSLMIDFLIRKSCVQTNNLGCHRVPINNKGFATVVENYSHRSDTYLGVKIGDPLVLLEIHDGPGVPVPVVYCLCQRNGNFGYLPSSVITIK